MDKILKKLYKEVKALIEDYAILQGAWFIELKKQTIFASVNGGLDCLSMTELKELTEITEKYGYKFFVAADKGFLEIHFFTFTTQEDKIIEKLIGGKADED